MRLRTLLASSVALLCINPAVAQETAPGDACTAVETDYIKQVGGPETSGVVRLIRCDGANWQQYWGFFTNGSVEIGANATAGGLMSFAIGEDTVASNNHNVAIGYGASASGYQSMALGVDTSATQHYDLATGYQSTASGRYSTAMGNATLATGRYSFVAGNASTASGWNGVSLGWLANASGQNSFAASEVSTALGHNSVAIGRRTHAATYGEVSLGVMPMSQNGTQADSATVWYADDVLFEIGNGQYPARSNAVTILKGGNVGIGTNAPEATLDVDGFAKLATNASSPATCAAGTAGSIALTSTHRMCVCDGTSWNEVNSVTTCTW